MAEFVTVLRAENIANILFVANSRVLILEKVANDECKLISKNPFARVTTVGAFKSLCLALSKREIKIGSWSSGFR